MNKIFILLSLLSSLAFAMPTKSDLEKLSDAELIIKALDSGNADKIEFAGSQALDSTLQSYEKDLANREELIKALVEPTVSIPGDADKPIEVEADSVVVDESTGFNQFMGDAVVTQGSLVLSADLIEVQTIDEEVESIVAKGSQQKPAKYIQDQHNQARFIEATAVKITYDVGKGIVFLLGDAHLVQGFDSFSGETLEYDIDNDKVLVNSSEDGVKRVKFKITL